MQTKQWTVDLFLSEEDELTRAHAVLHTETGRAAEGSGTARLNPTDRGVPEIGDEIAAGRALLRLAQSLLRIAEGDITAVTHEMTHIHS